MRLLIGRDAEVAFWVGLQIPLTAQRIKDGNAQPFGPCVAFGVINSKGELCAGVVFHSYDPYCRNIEVSCAATSRVWAKPEIVCAILRYAFQTAGCVRVTAVTPRRATSPRRFLEALGFQREGSVRRGFPNDNAIIYGLLAEDWAAHRINRPKERLTVEQEGLTLSAARA